MGKIFLLLIVAGFIWGAYQVMGHWNKTFHLDDEPKAKPDLESLPMVAATPAPTPAGIEESHEDFPQYFVMQAMTSEWVHLRQYGIVRRGEEILDNVIVLSWDRAGMWLSKAGQQLRVRWERYGEMVARVAEEVADSGPSVISAASVNPLGGNILPQSGESE